MFSPEFRGQRPPKIRHLTGKLKGFLTSLYSPKPSLDSHRTTLEERLKAAKIKRAKPRPTLEDQIKGQMGWVDKVIDDIVRRRFGR